jgi:hypothetical protein
MPDKEAPVAISEALQFDPRWWWDPVPPWILRALDRAVLVELAITQIELQKTIHEAQIKAADKSIALIRQKAK